MNENDFWVKVWTIAAVFVFGLFAISASSGAYSDYTMRLLIEQGNDPITVRCGIYGPKRGGGDLVMCVERAKK